MVKEFEFNGERVIVGRNGMALVASKSEPGRWHPVRVAEGAISQCDCKGFEIRGGCRHIRTVRLLNTQPVAANMENPTFALAVATLAGDFDNGPKRRENLHIADVTDGEEITFGEWRERRAS